MWGSSFADLAKQAADLQEQAAKKAAEFQQQASHVVENVPSAKETGFTSPVGFGSSAGGFFNMDALQSNEGENSASQQQAAETPPTADSTSDQNIIHEERSTADEQGNEEVEDQEALEKAWKERQLKIKEEKEQVDSEQGSSAAAPAKENLQAEDAEVEDGRNDNEEEDPGIVDGEDGENVQAEKVETIEAEKKEDEQDHDHEASSMPTAEVMDHDDPKVDNHASTRAMPKTLAAAEANMEPSIAAQQQAIPDHVMKQFSEQLTRLEENHATEKLRMQQEYNNEMQTLKQELSKRNQTLQQMQIDSKRSKEGYTLKLDAVQRELTGTQELLRDKEKEFKRLQEQHLKQLRGMEKQIFKQEDESQGNVNRVKALEQQLEEANATLEASNEEYKTLKERTKVVASELKERRADCRTLSAEVDLLKSNNAALQDEITQMQGESLDMNQNSQANQQERNTLKSQLLDIEKELEEARDGIKKETKKGDEALTSYKRKAQQSLAVANARAANAVQAREEAEMEARAARSTADRAMERALTAEQDGKEAQAKAKLYVADMQKEVAKYSDVKEAMEKAVAELEQAHADSSTLTETNAKQTCELQSVSGRLEASQKTIEDLNNELLESKIHSGELFEESKRLRHEIQRLKDDFQRLHVSLASESNVAEEKKDSMEQAKQLSLNSEAEATISMLRQELRDSNTAIKELKETLRATVEEAEAASADPQSQPAARPVNGDGGGGMPLFYAMEKQAELTQARNEITRLANLLGDSEADKQQAMDSTEEMERKMNEAMAKLRRQEQHDTRSPQEEQVNMEYLKNVTLSFVNASTLTEKKALLPVIGTVLCLTPEEQRKATEALDKNASGVMESVTTSVMGLRWGS